MWKNTPSNKYRAIIKVIRTQWVEFVFLLYYLSVCVNRLHVCTGIMKLYSCYYN